MNVKKEVCKKCQKKVVRVGIHTSDGDTPIGFYCQSCGARYNEKMDLLIIENKSENISAIPGNQEPPIDEFIKNLPGSASSITIEDVEKEYVILGKKEDLKNLRILFARENPDLIGGPEEIKFLRENPNFYKNADTKKAVSKMNRPDLHLLR
jgi:hypothetical protein